MSRAIVSGKADFVGTYLPISVILNLAVAVLPGILVLKEKTRLFRKPAGLTLTAAGLLMLNM